MNLKAAFIIIFIMIGTLIYFSEYRYKGSIRNECKVKIINQYTDTELGGSMIASRTIRYYISEFMFNGQKYEINNEGIYTRKNVGDELKCRYYTFKNGKIDEPGIYDEYGNYYDSKVAY